MSPSLCLGFLLRWWPPSRKRSKLPPRSFFSNSALWISRSEPPSSSLHRQAPTVLRYKHPSFPTVILFWQNPMSPCTIFWFLHCLISVSEQLCTPRRDCCAVYRTHFTCASTDLQATHIPVPLLTWCTSCSRISNPNAPPPASDLILHEGNGWNHMETDSSLPIFISGFSVELGMHLGFFSPG